jgi:outer membrane receptor protein involved in Fe transport
MGKRIVAAGSAPNPDIYELARPSLDASLRVPVFGTVALSADAENLLDRAYEQRQGNIIRERYRTGRTFSFGLRWQR